ncbi:hypothetical protein SEA_YASSJOHNNY_131 [Mycobacterium phage YassJohnny]|nr:hypothetical protein SEA_YASSJOHNNY_131 [Mycobacterium phage YassJohnny]
MERNDMVQITDYIRPWHGCLEHGVNHCADCKVCGCYEEDEG